VYIESWGETDKGKLRSDNQDTIYFARPGELGVTQEQIETHGHLLAVADGVAGDIGGKEASQSVINRLVVAYYGLPLADPGQNLRQAIQIANQQARQDVVYREAATTLVAAVIFGNQLYIANVGDSRLYWLRDDQIRQLTEDHVQDGKLARYLVSLPGAQPDMAWLPELRPGDRVLLCSDGLYDPVSNPDEIRRLAQRGSVKTATRRLIKRANYLGGPDNVSVVMAGLSTRPAGGGWMPQVMAGLSMILVAGFIIGSLWMIAADRQGSQIPTLKPTAMVEIETPTTSFASPDISATNAPLNPTVAASAVPGVGGATATLQPSRTVTLTPTNTRVPPTHTHTPTPTNTITLTPTATPSSPPTTPTLTETPTQTPDPFPTDIPAATPTDKP
jgi:PPM family protein phosphatase